LYKGWCTPKVRLLFNLFFTVKKKIERQRMRQYYNHLTRKEVERRVGKEKDDVFNKVQGEFKFHQILEVMRL